jgi:hypothetical protein
MTAGDFDREHDRLRSRTKAFALRHARRNSESRETSHAFCAVCTARANNGSGRFCTLKWLISREICDFLEKNPGFLGCFFVLVYF